MTPAATPGRIPGETCVGARPSRSSPGGCRAFPRPFLLAALATALGLAAAPGGASGIRVVSQTVGTDELLLALAEPAQVAALSHLATDPDFSAVAREAARYPLLDKTGDAEDVLQHHPTLALFADYSRGELVEQVRRAGVRILVFDRYQGLEDAFANLRLLAAALGGDAMARAEAIIGETRSRIAALRERLGGVRPVRVIAPSTYGMIPGADTTFQDICDHAGAENLASTLGGLRGHQAPPKERMLTWPVERVVLAGDDLDAALEVFRRLPPYSLMPAVREGRAVLLEAWQFSCVTHHRVRAYERLARALHPERFP